MLNSAAGVMLPGPPTVPARDHHPADQRGQSGRAGRPGRCWSAGPRATIVTASGAARTSSPITFSEGWRWCSSATHSSASPSPSLPYMWRPSTGGLSGGEAAPDPRPARRVELPRGSPGRSAWPGPAAHSRRRPSPRRLPSPDRTGHAQGHGVVDPRINVENYFSGHVSHRGSRVAR